MKAGREGQTNINEMGCIPICLKKKLMINESIYVLRYLCSEMQANIYRKIGVEKPDSL